MKKLIIAFVIIGLIVLPGYALKNNHSVDFDNPLLQLRTNQAIGSLYGENNYIPQNVIETVNYYEQVPQAGSLNPGSTCVGSLCGGSACAGSLCGGSTCVGSACIGTTCVVSVCTGSGCAASTCSGSGCSSACDTRTSCSSDSFCMGSACSSSGCNNSHCGASSCGGDECTRSANLHNKTIIRTQKITVR